MSIIEPIGPSSGPSQLITFIKSAETQPWLAPATKSSIVIPEGSLLKQPLFTAPNLAAGRGYLGFRSRRLLTPAGRGRMQSLLAAMKATGLHTPATNSLDLHALSSIMPSLRSPLDKDMDGPLQELMANFLDFLEEVMLANWQVINDDTAIEEIIDWAEQLFELKCHKLLPAQDALSGTDANDPLTLAKLMSKDKPMPENKLMAKANTITKHTSVPIFGSQPGLIKV